MEAMDKLFYPSSILVVGVSPSPTNMARFIVSNLINYGYPGRIHIMGKKGGAFAGQTIHTSLDEISDEIDMAVFLTPAAVVPELLEQCGRKGVKAAVIESGGFSELAEARQELEDRIKEIASKWGIKVVGPNGLGVINRENSVVVPFVPKLPLPPPGRTSLLTQSGGVGIVHLYALAAENVGLDKFVSMGNKLLLDEADYIEYITAKGTSDVICVYLEDVRRGRKFFDAILNFPGTVIIHKANVSRTAAEAARSHTASLSTDDRLVDAAIRQAGALRVEDMTTMVHHAMALSLPPLKGKRLLIMSRSGGHAVIAADYAERNGFVLPPLPKSIASLATQAGRANVIKAANPLDLGDVFDFQRYAAMLEEAVRSKEYDAIALIHVITSDLEARDSEKLCEAAARLTREWGKPIYLSFLGQGPELERIKGTWKYPLFPTPEILMTSMAASRTRYLRSLKIATASPPPPVKFDIAAISSILDRETKAALDEGTQRRWLPTQQVFELLKHASFHVAPFEIALTAKEAAAAGSKIGYPVAMKVLSADMLHKGRAGGVSLNIRNDRAAMDEFERLCELFNSTVPGGNLEGILVQKMVRGNREVFLGGRQDPSFGPVVALGFGGALVEVLNDITFRLCPVNLEDADEMITEVSLFKAFSSLPGSGSPDYEFLKECVCILSSLLVRFPEIDEIDLNPLKLFDVGEKGTIVDGRICLRV